MTVHQDIVQLPINTKPIIRAWQTEANVLNILSASYDNYLELIYPYFIQVFYAYSDHTLWFYYQDQNYDELFQSDRILPNKMSLSPDIIVNMLCNGFKNGYYAHIHVDEYYLPYKGAYQKIHFFHDSLLYGYDFATSEFLLCSYIIKGKDTSDYDVCRVSRDDLLLSIMECDISEVSFIRLKQGLTPHFDSKMVYAKLKSYLTSSESGQDGLSGLAACYQAINQYIQSSEQSRMGDHRQMRLLYEHKTLMYERIKYMNRLYHGLFDQEENEYAKVTEQFNKLFLLVLKHRTTKKNDLLARIQAVFEQGIKQEVSILNQLTNKMAKEGLA